VAQGSAQFHEAEETLKQATMERHRAIVSLMEELEAVDWYDQRVDATTDDSLRAILAHNRDEEKEHAAMTLEWLRRNDPGWDQMLRTYLFTEAPITEVEDEDTGGGSPSIPPPPSGPGGGAGSLGIGALSDKETL
jgi:ferritin-like protein